MHMYAHTYTQVERHIHTHHTSHITPMKRRDPLEVWTSRGVDWNPILAAEYMSRPGKVALPKSQFSFNE